MAKVTIYVDDEVWDNFKAQVFKKHGSLRKLSCEVENLLRASSVTDLVVLEFQKIGVNAKGNVSSHEIKSMRPQLKGPSSEDIIREMRHRRVAQTLS